MSADGAHQIAVVGISCNFPGAADVETFEKLVLEGSVAVRDVTAAERSAHPAHGQHTGQGAVTAGVLADVDQFDAEFFKVAPADAASMDPQHRLFLTEVARGLNNAGWPVGPERRVGVFAGCGENRYALRRVSASGTRYPWDQATAMPLLASYHLDLRGPSVFVHSMCSTSLTAVHLARRALQAGDCDMAVAGAASVTLPDEHGYLARSGGVMSASGRCRPFDAAADGTVPGSGVGVVVLKRLADAVDDLDDILAVISGSALNNDGADRMSFAAPSVRGQRAAITEAVRAAGVGGAGVAYVETHGTGTGLGDPIELRAMKEARAALSLHEPCAVSAAKGGIGHLDEAAGIAGLIKAVLAIRAGIVPPTPGHSVLSPHVDLGDSGLYVSTEAHAWPAEGRRRAAVTALGVGGTNAHLIVEQAPEAAAEVPTSDETVVLAMSAHTEAALDVLDEHVRASSAPVTSVAAALARRRVFRNWRRALVVGPGRPVPQRVDPEGELELLLGSASPASALALLQRAGFPSEQGDPGLLLVRSLLAAGLRSDTLVGTGEGTYLAVSAAGGLDVEVAQRCAQLHRAAVRAATSRDLAVPEARADALYQELEAAELTPLDVDVRLQRTGVVLPAGTEASIDDLVEESMASFEGVQAQADPSTLDAAHALTDWSSLLQLLARAWERGADVSWDAVAPRARRATLPLVLSPRSHWSLAAVDAEACAAEDAPVVAPVADAAGPTDVMGALAVIWEEVLGVLPTAQDSFFALGGHSIHAAQMLARILERLDVRCTLGELLEAETLAGMSELVTRQRRIDSLVAPAIDDGRREGEEVFEL